MCTVLTLTYVEKCKTCKTKTKIIGGNCILPTHQDRVDEIKKNKGIQKKRREKAENQLVKKICACGCWALLRPGQNVAVVEVMDMGDHVITNTPINELDTDTVVASGAAGIAT